MQSCWRARSPPPPSVAVGAAWQATADACCHGISRIRSRPVHQRGTVSAGIDLHRCFQRHGNERLPDVDGNKSSKQKFKAYPIGYFHIDIAEVRTSEGKLHIFVAIDRTSKFAYVELHQKATTAVSKQFLDNLVAAVPYKIHTVLTDNGIQFTDPTGESWTPADLRMMRAEGKLFRCHAFENGCAIHDIDHRLTKPKHPWTNGQVEHMNRTIKQATVHRYHYDSHDQLRQPTSRTHTM